ncbi:Histidine kinase [Flavobacterium longum]|uniref:sensor histidine kinase n=1 Tax=Flavobacterium longum TaxID=1299340 RepID=UPI0039E955AE
MNKKFRQIIINATGCLIFLSLPVFSSPDFGAMEHMLRVTPFKRNFLSFVFLLLFFYVNYYALIPRLYFRGKLLAYFFALVCSYLIINFLPEILIPEHFPHHRPHFHPPHRHSGRMNFFFSYLRSLVQFAAIFFLALYLRINRRLRNAEKEKLKAEVSYLKAQINPHFLFNTLNSLYALTLEKSDAAPDAVLKLSGMMRYVVTESINDFVPLQKELDYISDYIELQRLRIVDDSKLSYLVKGNPEGKQISPLVIIPFIENAFKYGVNGEEDWRISISIDIQDNLLTLVASNNQVTMNFHESSGSEQGIDNTKKRLNYIYPDQHELHIEDGEKAYRVTLKIRLS